MKSKQNGAEWNEPFPLDEYYAVYEWIGRWAEVTDDPTLQPIAQAACESLRAVGLIILETMRFMNETDSSRYRPRLMEDRDTRKDRGAAQGLATTIQ